jgi:hypothetical protein
MMSSEEIEAKRKTRRMPVEVDSLITKSEMRSEMRCMIQELMGMGLIGPKVSIGPSELK